MPNTQLTRQIGEHLVVAELGRHGIIATPFAGNLPFFDVVALDKNGRAIYLQVKAINSGDWQLNADHFISIVYNKDLNTQSHQPTRAVPIAPLIFILMKIVAPGKDEFFVLSYEDLQKMVVSAYKRIVGKSTHFALKRSMVEKFKVDNLSAVHLAIQTESQKDVSDADSKWSQKSQD